MRVHAPDTLQCISIVSEASPPPNPYMFILYIYIRSITIKQQQQESSRASKPVQALGVFIFNRPSFYIFTPKFPGYSGVTSLGSTTSHLVRYNMHYTCIAPRVQPSLRPSTISPNQNQQQNGRFCPSISSFPDKKLPGMFSTRVNGQTQGLRAKPQTQISYITRYKE